jgi:hypothetical protein
VRGFVPGQVGTGIEEGGRRRAGVGDWDGNIRGERDARGGRVRREERK